VLYHGVWYEVILTFSFRPPDPRFMGVLVLWNGWRFLIFDPVPPTKSVPISLHSGW